MSSPGLVPYIITRISRGRGKTEATTGGDDSKTEIAGALDVTSCLNVNRPHCTTPQDEFQLALESESQILDNDVLPDALLVTIFRNTSRIQKKH